MARLLAPGTPAPDFSLPDGEGNLVILGTIRDSWVGEHPGVLPELSIVFDALRKLEGVPEQDEMQTGSALDDDWSQGTADAAVTLLEYGDLECPDCGRAGQFIVHRSSFIIPVPTQTSRAGPFEHAMPATRRRARLGAATLKGGGTL